MSFMYKIAETALEFEQIHESELSDVCRRKFRSTTETNQDKLVDKFHDENTYIICKKDDRSSE